MPAARINLSCGVADLTIKNKRDLFPIFAVLLGVLGAAALFAAGMAARSRGGLSIRVVDAYDLTPVKNAEIIIPSAGIFTETDASGLAAATLPIIKNGPQEKALSQWWGECTIIAGCPGYRPTVMLYAHVYRDKLRRAVIYLFPEDKDGEEIITIAESPDEEWIKALVEKYLN